MGEFESILTQANLLSIGDRKRLASLLLQEIGSVDGVEDDAVGQRGLAAWTESARIEDWSEFYPARGFKSG